jgi:peptide/nickel transport system substrate-binding protein
MSSETVKPEGTTSVGNWHRYASASADAALAAFEAEPDIERQRLLGEELQRTFVDEAPAIPLYPNPSWAEYNTKRFEGFPSAENPYADPSPNKFGRGEVLIVLTTIAPR